MTWSTGQTLGRAICKPTGLDPHEVRSITLRCDVSDVATLEVEHFVRTDAVDEIATAIATYTLVECGEES